MTQNSDNQDAKDKTSKDALAIVAHLEKSMRHYCQRKEKAGETFTIFSMALGSMLTTYNLVRGNVPDAENATKIMTAALTDAVNIVEAEGAAQTQQAVKDRLH